MNPNPYAPPESCEGAKTRISWFRVSWFRLLFSGYILLVSIAYRASDYLTTGTTQNHVVGGAVIGAGIAGGIALYFSLKYLLPTETRRSA